MQTISQLRTTLKPLGFDIELKNTSWGKQATYINLQTNERLQSNLFTKQTLEKWSTLLEFIKQNQNVLEALGKKLSVYGLVKG